MGLYSYSLSFKQFCTIHSENSVVSRQLFLNDAYWQSCKVIKRQSSLNNLCDKHVPYAKDLTENYVGKRRQHNAHLQGAKRINTIDHLP